jgi:hypothetical protein
MAATDAVDLSQEPQHIHELYGTQPGKESFANNCLLARRLVERGVRYVQRFSIGVGTRMAPRLLKRSMMDFETSAEKSTGPRRRC